MGMRKIIMALIAIVVLMFVFYALNAYIYMKKQGDSVSQNQQQPKRITLTGTYVCLPHKDKTRSQTDECAIGLRSDDGMYYVLDFNLMSQQVQNLTTGDRISATGVFTPLMAVSTDQWSKYDVIGIFSVTDSLKKI